MDRDYINGAIQEVERLAYLAGAGPHSSPSPDVPPEVHAQLAQAWAIVALARAIVFHADRPPPT